MSRSNKTNSRRSFNQTTLAQSLHQASHPLSPTPSTTHSKSDRAGFADTLRRVLFGASGIGLIFGAGGVEASDIQTFRPGDSSKVTTSGSRIVIANQTISGVNALNTFQKFNVSNGDTANFINAEKANNILNFVKERIEISGTVNALRDNKIGGNLYFLSSQGMIVSASGAINAGSLYVMSPKPEFMDKFFTDQLTIQDTDPDLAKIVARKVGNRVITAADGTQSVEVGIPINPDATITIQGRIRAIDNIELYAGKALSVSGGTQDAPIMQTGVLDFGTIVNLPAEIQTSGLVMSAGDNGNIVLRAATQTRPNLTIAGDQSTYGSSATATDGDWVESVKEVADTVIESTGVENYTKHTAIAELTIDGTITAANNFLAQATAENGELTSVSKDILIGEWTRDYTGGFAIANVGADVRIKEHASIHAANISISANALNSYQASSSTGVDLMLTVLGALTPFDMAPEIAFLNANALVMVDAGALINATEKLDVNADSTMQAIISTKNAPFNLTTHRGVAAGMIYVDSSNTAMVNIDGLLKAKEITVAANADETMDAGAVIKAKIPGTNDEYLAGAVVIADAANNAWVTLASNASLTATDALTVSAKTISSILTDAATHQGDNGYVAAAFNMTDFNSDANVVVDGNLTSDGDVSVLADNHIVQYITTATSAIGLSKKELKRRERLLGIGEQANSRSTALISRAASSSSYGRLYKVLREVAQNTDPNTTLGISGGVMLATGKIASNVTIKSGSKIQAGNNLKVDATTTVEDFHFAAVSKGNNVHKKGEAGATEGKISASAAVAYSDIYVGSSVTLEDTVSGGTNLSAKTIAINSKTDIQYNRIQRMWESLQDLIGYLDVLSSNTGIPDEVRTKLKELLDGPGDILEAIRNPSPSASPTDLVEGTNLDNFFNRLVAISDALTGPSDNVEEEGPLTRMMDDLAEISPAWLESEQGIAAQLVLTKLVEQKAWLDAASYANVHASATAAPGAEDGLGVSATLAMNLFNVDSKIQVGNNVKINSAADLSVHADANIEHVAISGVQKLKKLIKGTNSSMLGGTFMIEEFNPTTSVIINEGASLISNDAAAQSSGDITVSANNDTDLVSIAVQTNKASSENKVSLGLSAMISYLRGKGLTQVAIDDDVTILGKDINILAQDNTWLLNISGSTNTTKGGSGLGAAIALTEFDRNVIATIADQDNETDTDAGTISGNSFGLFAKAFGESFTIGVAGSSSKTGDPNADKNKEEKDNESKINVIDAAAGGDGQSRLNKKETTPAGDVPNNVMSKADDKLNERDKKLDGDSQTKTDGLKDIADKGGDKGGTLNTEDGADVNSVAKQASKIDIAATGSVALNLVENSSSATVGGARIVLNGQTDSDMKVEAVNTVNHVAGAGGASFLKNKDPNQSVGIAITGAAAANDLKNDVTAMVTNSVINGAEHLTVAALNGGYQVAAGLGLVVNTSSHEATSASLSASASINLLDNKVKALLVGNTVSRASGQTDLDVLAYQSDLQIAGGLKASLGNEKLGVGATVNIADFNNTIEAAIDGGAYSNIGSTNVKALAALTQINAGLNMGFNTQKETSVGLQGLMTWNEINNDLIANIRNVNTLAATGSVNVLARDISSSLASEYEAQLNKASATLLDTDKMDDSLAPDLTGSSYLTGIRTIKDSGSADNDPEEDDLALPSGEGMLIVSAGLVLAGGTSDNNYTGDAAVLVNQINNNFTASIDASTITATAVNTDALALTDLYSVAGSVGGSKGGALGGSVVWNEISNTLASGFNDSQITAADVAARADNSGNILGIAGQIGYAQKFGIGIGIAYNKIHNVTHAYQLGGSLSGSGSLALDANNSSNILGFAISLGGGKDVGIGGSVAVNEITDDTITEVDKGEAGQDAVIKGYASTTVKATDTSDIKSTGGSITGSKTTALGGGVAVNTIKGATRATASNATINTNLLDVAATNKAEIWSLGAAGGGAGKVAVSGAAVAAEIERTIASGLSNVRLDDTDDPAASDAADNKAVVNITTDSEGIIYSSAVSLAFAGNAAVGVGVAVNQINDDLSSTITSGTINAERLALSSGGAQAIKTIGVGGSGSGTAGITGSTAYNAIGTNNIASINAATITTDGSLGVVAQTDDTLMNYAGVLAVGGTAGVGLSVSINNITGTTAAQVSGGTYNVKGSDAGITTHAAVKDSDIIDEYISDETVSITDSLAAKRQADTHTGLVIDSSATHTMKSFIVNAAGSGAVAVTGTVNINRLEGKTTAELSGATLNNTVAAADAGNVRVRAQDYTNDSAFVGSLSIAAEGAAVGAATDTHLLNRDTSAIVNSLADAAKAKDFDVLAKARQGVASLTAGGAGAAIGAGVAAMGTIVLSQGITSALLDNSKQMELQTLNVDADHLARTYSLAGSLGIGVVGAGVGAGVTVNLIEDEVSAQVNNSTITVKGSDTIETIDGKPVITRHAVKVSAENNSSLNALTIAVAGGAGAVSGAVAVNNMTNKVITSVKGSSIDNSSVSAGSIKVAGQDISTLNGTVGGASIGGLAVGVAVSVNSMDGQVTTDVVDSQLLSSGDISISADEQRDTTQNGGAASAGAVAAAGTVMVAFVGTELPASSSEDGMSDVKTRVADVKTDFAGGSIRDGVDVVGIDNEDSLDVSLANADLTAKASAFGRTSTNVANSSLASGKNVKVLADETTNTTMNTLAAEAGIYAGGAAVGLNTINRNVAASVTGSNLTANAITIDGTAGGKSKLDMVKGTAGVIAASAAYGRISMSGNVQTLLRGATLRASLADATQPAISITAHDNSQAATNAWGANAGLLSMGALVTDIVNTGITQVSLSDNTFEAGVVRNGTGVITERNGNIVIEAKRDNTLDAYTFGFAGGVIAGAGIVSRVDDDGQALVEILDDNLPSTNSTSIEAMALAINANNQTSVTSEAKAFNVSGVGVGVALAEIDTGARADINIGSDMALRANTVNVSGQVSGNNAVRVEANTVSLVGGIVYNEAKSSNNSAVDVRMGANTFLGYATDLSVTGMTNVTQQADIKGLTVGRVVASGNNRAKTAGNASANVAVDGGSGFATAVRQLTVSADTGVNNTAHANGDGGGLINISADAAVAINNASSQAITTVAGKWAVSDSAILTAAQDLYGNVKADSLQASAAGFSGTKTDNTINAVTQMNFADGAELTLNTGNLEFSANNNITTNDPGQYNTQGSGYGGIAGAAADSNVSVNSNTAVNIGRLVKLRATLGSILADAHTQANITNRVQVKGAAGIALPFARANTNLVFSDAITVGEGAYLETLQPYADIALSATADLTAKITSDSDLQGGIAGTSQADNNINIVKNNTITVAGYLFSTNDVRLATDADSKDADSYQYLESSAEALNKSAGAYSEANLNSNTQINHLIDIRPTAVIDAIRHIDLSATSGDMVSLQTTYEWAWHHSDATGGYSSSALGDKLTSAASNSRINIDGTLTAGLHNKVNVVLDGIVDPGSPKTLADATGLMVSGEGSDFYKDRIINGIKFIDYANALTQRYNDLVNLVKAYSGTVAGAGYEAELSRVIEEMASMGLTSTTPSGGQQPVAGMIIAAVELPDMVASGGNIVLNLEKNSGTVSGTGSIYARGGPELKIQNNTNLYMIVNDLMIADYGGEIILNKESLGTDAAARLPTLAHAVATPSADALIDVNATWDPNNKLNVIGGSPATAMPTIEINGNVENLLGTVQIKNDHGDILVQGKTAFDSASVNAKTVKMLAPDGSITQGYSNTTQHIGGDPSALWAEYAKEKQNEVNGGSGNKVATTTGNGVDYGTNNQAGRIAGGTVYINAADINVNGLIQSGYEQYTFEMTEAIKDKIANYDYLYAHKLAAAKEYLIAPSGSVWNAAKGYYDYSLAAYYNPATKEIRLQDVSPRGGRVYLVGRVSSTGNGRIKAMDGAAKINVSDTLTDRTINLGQLDVGDVEGLISITDTQRGIVTEYSKGLSRSYDIGDFNEATGQPNYKTPVAGTSFTYQPDSSLRFNWSSGQTQSDHYYYYESRDVWIGFIPGSEGASFETMKNLADYTPSQMRDLLPGAYIDQVSAFNETEKNADYALYFQRIEDPSSYTVGSRNWDECGFLCIKRTYYREWWANGKSMLAYLHSIKANKGIAVDFIGSDAGEISVNAKGNLVMNGNVTGVANTKIGLTSNQGSITQRGGTLSGSDVMLKAAAGIGETSRAINHKALLDTNKLSAITGSGDIAVLSTAAAGVKGDLQLVATTNGGNVNINAEGSLTQVIGQGADAINVKGQRIDLGSLRGSIGTLSNPLNIIGGQTEQMVPGEPLSASVNAQAFGDVALIQTQGNMRLGRVYSDFGDVVLKVPQGAFIDALPDGEEIVGNSRAQMIKKWKEMGLIDVSIVVNSDGTVSETDAAKSNAATRQQQAQQAFEDAIASEYKELQRWQADNAAYVDQAASTHRDMTHVQMDELVAEIEALPVEQRPGHVGFADYLAYKNDATAFLDQAAANKRSEVTARMTALNSKFGGMDAATYLTTDPHGDYAYVKDVSHFGWTLNQLFYAIQDSIMNPDSGSSVTVNKDPNVKGRNVTLDAKVGIGTNLPQITLDLTNLESNLNVLKELAQAQGTDVRWGYSSYDFESESGTADASKAVLRRTLPVGVESSEQGSIRMYSDGNIYFISDGGNRTNIDEIISTGGDVRVQATHGVFAKDTTKTTPDIKAGNLLIEGGDQGTTLSKIGDTDAPLKIEITGALSAAADGAINLYQLNTAGSGVKRPLQIAYAYSGSDITLRAVDDLRSVNTGIVGQDLGRINAAGVVNLTSDTGNIGESATGKGLRVQVDNAGVNAVAAYGSIYLQGEINPNSPSGNDLKLLLLQADNGEIRLVNTHTGITLADNVLADALMIDSEGHIVQTSNDKKVDANDVTLTAEDGITLANSGNTIDTLTASNSETGNINVVNSKAITLKGVNSAAGDASITTSAGAITLAKDAYAYKNLTLKGQKGVEAIAEPGTATANLKAETGFVSVTSVDGMTKLNTVDAGADITVDSSGAVSLTTATAGDNIDVKSASGGVAGDNWKATTGNVKMVNQSGATTLNSVYAGTDIEVTTADGRTTLTTANAGRDFIVAQGIGDVWLTSVDAGNDILINIATGNLGDMLLDPPVGRFIAGRDISIDVIDGGVNIHTLRALGNNVTVAAHSDESLFVYDIESQQDTTLTNDNDGDIGFNRLIAQQNGTLKTFNGNIYIGAEFETVNGDMWVEAENGEIFSVGNLTSGNNMSLIGGSGVSVTGDISARRNVYVSNRVGGIDLNTLTSKEGSAELKVRESGDLAVKLFDVYGDTSLSTKVGSIAIGDGIAHTGSIKATSSDTGSISANTLNAAQNITLTAMIGNISIGDRLANSGSAIANNGFINASVGGTGNIEASNLSAQLDVILNTQSGSIRLGNRQNGTGLVESKAGAINLATGYTDMNSGANPDINANYRPDQVNGLAAGGDIDAHALLALHDILANSGAGSILMTTLDGEDMVFTLGGDDTLIDVQHAVLSSNELTVEGDNIAFGRVTHKGNDGYIYIDLAGTNGPINNVVFGSIDTPTGVHVNGLYTNTGYIHTSGENFRLEGVYAIDRVYLSNVDTRVTLFGRNPYLDDSDVQLYFVPTSAHPFARLSFQNEWADGLEIYRVLHDDPRNPSAKDPSNQWSDLQTSAAVFDSNRAWLLLFDADGDGKPDVIDLSTDAIELNYPLVPDLVVGATDKQLLIYQDLGEFFLHYPIIIEEEEEKK